MTRQNHNSQDPPIGHQGPVQDVEGKLTALRTLIYRHALMPDAGSDRCSNYILRWQIERQWSELDAERHGLRLREGGSSLSKLPSPYL